MELEAKLYMIFDMLGDMERSGPLLWCVDRKRTEDIKDHVFDLIVIVKILEKYFPPYIDCNKIIMYALVHDLEEAITGDITVFEGVSKEEKIRVNSMAMEYLIKVFNSVIDFNTYMHNYEEKVDIESHILHMIDKVEGSIPFIKYDAEKEIDIDNPNVIPELRYSKAVVDFHSKGESVGEGFYHYHLKSVVITDEQLEKYNISREDADKITNAIKGFMKSIFIEAKRVEKIKKDFPSEASKYKRL